MEVANSQPAARNLPVIRTQEELKEALTLFGDRYNVLIPRSLNFSSPLHRVAIEIVHIDNTVDEKGNGKDIYSTDGKKFTLHYKAANRIARAAGVKWVEPRIESRETDETGRVTFIALSVGWEVKRPSGAKSEGRATGFYRFAEDEKRLSELQAERRRQFAESHAETNAKLRAIYEALDLLSREMTREEYAKPFVVPCVTEDISEFAKNDPEIRKMLVANALGITDQVYGRALTKGAVEVRGEAEVVDTSAKVLRLDTKIGRAHV